MSFKVARPHGRWRYFASLADAVAFAERVRRRTGSIVEIQASGK